MWLTLFWCGVLAMAIILFYKQKYSMFKNRGIKYMTPVPVMGNFAKSLFCIEHITEYLMKAYKSFPNERFFGHFEFTQPVVMVRDLELVKQITIKDFDHFEDHRTVVDDKVDPFWGRSLFSLKGYEWRDMRATLSPAFTSSKIRLMVPFMTEVGDAMVRSIKQKLKAGSNSVILDVRDLTTRYSSDVIASCAFGLKVDSHSVPDNAFYTIGLEASTFKLKQFIVFFAYNSFPKLMSFFKISIFSKTSKKFFKSLVTKTMQEREEKNIHRPDMIHLLMEAKKGKLSYDDKTKDTDVGFATVEESDVGKQKTTTEWSNDDITAQALIFVLGGLDTLSSVMTFALYELAINSDVQERLYKEIKEYNAKNKGNLDFDTLQRMVYLDQVVSEVLRLWTPGFMLDRRCVKDYNIGKPNPDAKEDYIIRKGEALAIPVCAFHRDPEYFPNPDKFDPERFSEQNKDKIKPFAYMPFGIGPRNCIGSRFALCELKAILYQIILNIEVSPTKDTTIPIRISKFSFNPRVANGNVLQFKIRQ